MNIAIAQGLLSDMDCDTPKEATTGRPNLDVSLDDLIQANRKQGNTQPRRRHDDRRPREDRRPTRLVRREERRRSPVGRRDHSPPRSPHTPHTPQDHRQPHYPRRHRSPPPRRTTNPHSTPRGVKLIVSNLHYDVSRDDLKALFETVGAVLRVYMHFDRAGRSNGVAEVTFARWEDARVAQERYHNMPLDGYPMQIETQTAPLRSDYDMALD